jgi:hypothetical protein
MEEDDHFTQTLLPLLWHTAAHGSRAAALGSPSFSLVLYCFALSSSSICAALLMPIYKQEWCHQLQLFFNNGGCQPLTFGMGAHGWCSSSCSCCICQWTVPSVNGYCTLMATNPTITPFAINVGQLSSCFFSTSLHPAALPSFPFWEHLRPSLHGTCHTFHSPELPKHTFSHTKGSLQLDGLPLHIWRVLSLVSGTTFPFKCINHAWSRMIYQASHQGLQYPLKWKFPFPSATVIIWVSQYDHELTTLPRVYSSRSCVCPLFHPRNHALLLHESLALSPKSSGSSPSLTMWAAH